MGDGQQAEPPASVPSGYLLDLVSNTESEQGSLRRLTEVAAQTISSLAGVDIDCAATLKRVRRGTLSAANNQRAATLAALEDGGGPMADALGSVGSVVVGTYGGSLAIPVRLDASSTCALVLLGPAGFKFAPEVVGEAHRFAAVASHSLKLALEVHGIRSAADNLGTVLESRKSIDVACGVIMAQTRSTYSDAFGKLANTSQLRGLQVSSVAESVLQNLTSDQTAKSGR